MYEKNESYSNRGSNEKKSVAKGNFLSFSAPCGDILPCLDKYTIR